MILAKHHHEGRLMICLYDSELTGKKLEDEHTLLDLGSTWYKGEESSEETILKYTKNAESIHVIGTKSVSFVINQKLAAQEDVKEINSIPHVQIMRI